MGYHGVKLLLLAVKLDGITTIFVADRVGLLVFEWPLLSVLFVLFLKYFALCRIVPGAMHQAFFFTCQMIACMASMIIFALASAAIIWIGW